MQEDKRGRQRRETDPDGKRRHRLSVTFREELFHLSFSGSRRGQWRCIWEGSSHSAGSNRSKRCHRSPRVTRHPRSVTTTRVGSTDTHTQTHTSAWTNRNSLNGSVVYRGSLNITHNTGESVWLNLPPVTPAGWHLWLALKCLDVYRMDCLDIWWRHSRCLKRRMTFPPGANRNLLGR